MNKMQILNQINALISSGNFAIYEPRMSELGIQSIIDNAYRGDISADMALEQIRATKNTAGVGDIQQSPSIAVIPMIGMVMSRAGWLAEFMDVIDPHTLAGQISAAAANPSVKKIILYADSPGGTVSGTDIGAAAIAKASAAKPVITVVEGLNASAMYWMASQSTEIVGSPNSVHGSIGVMTRNRDISGALAQLGIKDTIIRSTPDKAVGQPGEAFTADMQAIVQAEINSLYEVFAGDVARGRGISIDKVKSWTAAVFVGQEAVKAGLIDRIGTLSEVLQAELAQLPTTTGSARRAEEKNMKYSLKTHTGELLEIDTESPDSAVAIQDNIYLAYSAGLAEGQKNIVESTSAIFGLEPKDFGDPKNLQKIVARASDGDSYRADLEGQMTAACVRKYGAELGAAQAETFKKTFAVLSAADLKAQVSILEADSLAAVPGGKVSEDQAPANVVTKTSKVNYDKF
jgi:capsid assembly protease